MTPTSTMKIWGQASAMIYESFYIMGLRRRAAVRGQRLFQAQGVLNQGSVAQKLQGGQGPPMPSRNLGSLREVCRCQAKELL